MREVHQQKRQRKTVALHLGFPLVVACALVLVRISLLASLQTTECNPAHNHPDPPLPGQAMCDWRVGSNCSVPWEYVVWTDSFSGQSAPLAASLIASVETFAFGSVNLTGSVIDGVDLSPGLTPHIIKESSFDAAVTSIHALSAQYYAQEGLSVVSPDLQYTVPTAGLYFSSVSPSTGLSYVLQAPDLEDNAIYYPKSFPGVYTQHRAMNHVSNGMASLLSPTPRPPPPASPPPPPPSNTTAAPPPPPPPSPPPGNTTAPPPPPPPSPFIPPIIRPISLDLLGLEKYPFVCYPGSGPKVISAVIFLFVLPFAASFLLPVLLQNMVREKQDKLVEIQKMSGLRMSVFWLVNYAFDFFVYCAIVTLMLTILAIGQLEVLLLTNGLVTIVVFFVWGHALVCLTYFFSVFFSSSLSAAIFGYVAQLLSIGIAATLNVTVYSDLKTVPSVLYSVYPPFAFFRAVYILVVSFTLDDPLTFRSLYWDTLLSRELMFMSVVSVVLLMLTVYLEAVLPKEYGVPASPLFPIYSAINAVRSCLGTHTTTSSAAIGWSYVTDTASLMDSVSSVSNPPRSGPRSWRVSATTEEENRDLRVTSPWVIISAAETDEVAREREAVYRIDGVVDPFDGAESNVVIRDLTKSYSSLDGRKTRALDSLCLKVGSGECLALLGPNGSGKSTLVNILCGLLRPSSGDALVAGLSIRTQMSRIHSMIGVCPQHDVLWPDLSVRDHLMFYARLKGISRKQERGHVDDILQQLGLKNCELQWPSSISAGMRRRLSIAIALIGNPRLLILDEPTYGVDVMARRNIWDILLRARQGRSILLTTHSMEEARVLSSRIAIVISGKLRTIGTHDELKARFGSEYRLEVSLSSGIHLERMRDFVASIAPSARIWSSFGSKAYTWLIPKNEMVLSAVFSAMEDRAAEAGIKSWSLALADLEELFFSLVASTLASDEVI